MFKWIDNYTVVIACVGVGLFFFYHEFSRPNLSSNEEVIYVDGELSSYSFKKTPGFRATSKEYYIWLKNYSCTFQIKADFLPFFSQKHFENEISINEKITLSIPKEYANQLKIKNQKIFILSASNKDSNYLSLDYTIPAENDHFDIYAGFAFIIIGIILYFLIRNKVKK